MCVEGRYLSGRMLVNLEDSGGSGKGVCGVLVMLVIYINVYGVSMVVYVLLVAINDWIVGVGMWLYGRNVKCEI